MQAQTSPVSAPGSDQEFACSVIGGLVFRQAGLKNRDGYCAGHFLESIHNCKPRNRALPAAEPCFKYAVGQSDSVGIWIRSPACRTIRFLLGPDTRPD